MEMGGGRSYGEVLWEVFEQKGLLRGGGRKCHAFIALGQHILAANEVLFAAAATSLFASSMGATA